jgi:hypothetical protein
MIRKNKLSILLILFALSTGKMNAQPYATGIGVRFGGIATGITVKHYTNSNTALEGILGFGRHSLILTGLYEKHQEFPSAPGLSWFYGGGAHLGFVSHNYSYYDFYYKSHKHEGDADLYDSNVFFGADFILGMEYKFKDAPISLGLDIKPYIDLLPGFYGYWEGAFTFRFTL